MFIVFLIVILVIAGIVTRILKKKESSQINTSFDDLESEIQRQFQTQAAETETANEAEDLAPEVVDGKKIRYHYKDVSIIINWEYGGQYGGSLQSLGVKRGDKLRLVQKPEEDDLQNISVFWKNTEIGRMKQNQMREMVIRWQDSGYPIFAAVNLIGEQYKLLAEIAFYGYIRKNAANSPMEGIEK